MTIGENSDMAGNLGIDGFLAQRGYDLTTGWGTPDLAHFIPDLLDNLDHQSGESGQSG
jgi:hypothetical protein